MSDPKSPPRLAPPVFPTFPSPNTWRQNNRAAGLDPSEPLKALLGQQLSELRIYPEPKNHPRTNEPLDPVLRHHLRR